MARQVVDQRSTGLAGAIKRKCLEHEQAAVLPRNLIAQLMACAIVLQFLKNAERPEGNKR